MMKTKVSRWGNSLGIASPKEVGDEPQYFPGFGGREYRAEGSEVIAKLSSIIQ
ncbi:MAG: hypothetical protein JJU00_16235 [Opitutales bacterium]|nr:hypothetical protein [Opitutales bacterium]